MSEMKLFENAIALPAELLEELQATSMSGGSGGMPRISIKGSRFRQIVGGEQVAVNEGNSMNIVIIEAAPLSRVYYAGSYNADVATSPTCWSSDTNAPDDDVLASDRQSDRCLDCEMNVKGSGQNESRACRFGQRLAIVPEGLTDQVYQMQLPATSIFGDVEANNMPMQAYGKFLNAHKTPAIAIVTQAFFDVDSEVPKLFFKPVRPLEQDELTEVLALRSHPDTKQAVTLSMSNGAADKEPEKLAPLYSEDEGEEPEEKPKPKAKAKARAKPKAKAKAKEEEPEEEEEEEEVAEPTKMKTSKGKAVPEDDGDEDDELASLLDQWDD